MARTGMSRTSLLTAALIAVLSVFACGDDHTVTAYSLVKVAPESNNGHEWLPTNLTKYSVREETVVSETASIVSEYHDCKISSPKDWECFDSGKMGKLGFRNGSYWQRPESPGVKYVSMFEYNRVRCVWELTDPYVSFFRGAVRCIIQWE